MDKRFVAVLAGIIVILGGIFFITNHKSGAPGTTNSNVSATNHVEGQGKAGVTLIEYGDYQCPACGEYYPALKQVFDKYQSQIFFQFRNFPLTQIHQNAFAGARAAEAADLQGKYWQMHDLLYENQNSWSTSSDPQTFFDQYAQSLGLNVSKFKTDFASSQVNDRINKDISIGNSLGFAGTPSFVLDGQVVSNPAPTLDAFSQILDKEIATKTAAH